MLAIIANYILEKRGRHVFWDTGCTDAHGKERIFKIVFPEIRLTMHKNGFPKAKEFRSSLSARVV